MSLPAILALIHPDDRLRVMALWPRAVKGEAVYEIEYRVVLDGHEYWHSVKAEFERDEQGCAVRAASWRERRGGWCSRPSTAGRPAPSP